MEDEPHMFGIEAYQIYKVMPVLILLVAFLVMSIVGLTCLCCFNNYKERNQSNVRLHLFVRQSGESSAMYLKVVPTIFLLVFFPSLSVIH